MVREEAEQAGNKWKQHNGVNTPYEQYSFLSLNSFMHPVLMFLLNLLFLKNSSHAISLHSNLFLLMSPDNMQRSPTNFFISFVSVSTSSHSSLLVTYLYLDSYTSIHPVQLLFLSSSSINVMTTHPLTSSLCTSLMFHTKEILLLPSSSLLPTPVCY